MTQRINRVPWGLQGLLDSQSMGDNPSELSSLAVPTVDLDVFLQAQLAVVQATVTVITAVNQLGTILVPQGEVWLPQSFSWQYIPTIAAGSRAGGSLYVQVPSIVGAGNQTQVLTFGQSPVALDTALTSNGYGFVYSWNFPQAYTAGASFQGIVTDLDLNGGTSGTLRLGLAYRRFRV